MAFLPGIEEGDLPLLAVEDFSFAYAQQPPVITQAEFSLYPGQISLLLGRSGSGKTTLLKNLKPILAPRGQAKGQILFGGKPLASLSPEEGVCAIGFVFQDPNAQLVMDTVYEELAFGLENLGLEWDAIKERIADTVSFCGIEHLLAAKTADLSGGQKQLVNLCAVLCFRPQVLLLDEPFSQLDPESARRVLEILQRTARETGAALLLSEQRLDRLWHCVDQVIYLEQGKTAFTGSARDFAAFGLETGKLFGLPPVSKIFAQSGREFYALPLSLGEGRSLLAAWQLLPGDKQREGSASALVPTKGDSWGENPVVFFGKEVSFGYAQSKKIIFKQLSLSLRQGQRLILCGGNGAGKTTLLHTMAGILKPLQGKWQVLGQGGGVGFLSQTPQHHFGYDTPHQEFLHIDKNYQENREFMAIIRKLGLTPLLEEELYTLSYGQQQRVALAMALAPARDIYLLDEPTKGLDEENKQALGEILQQKTASAVLMATHDLEFAAAFGNSFTTLCDGSLTGIKPKEQFFGERYWQTTDAAKLFAGIKGAEGWHSLAEIPKNWYEALKK